MRKLSIPLCILIILSLASCKSLSKDNCEYEPVNKGEEFSVQLMEKYVGNFHVYFKCPEFENVEASKLPPDNGLYVIRPDTMPCPPPPCRNSVLMSAVTKNPKAVLIIEGKSTITLNAIKIDIPEIKKDYYGFVSAERIFETEGVLKITLIEDNVEMVRHIKFKK